MSCTLVTMHNTVEFIHFQDRPFTGFVTAGCVPPLLNELFVMALVLLCCWLAKMSDGDESHSTRVRQQSSWEDVIREAEVPVPS